MEGGSGGGALTGRREEGEVMRAILLVADHLER
jgi:hypothetical protein